jgi:hypothetical protein
MLVTEQIAQLDQRDIHFGFDRCQDHAPLGFDVMQTKVATLRQSRHTTLDASGTDPADRARHCDAEAFRRGVAGDAAINGRDHARAQILRQGSCHAGWPPLQHAW